MPAVRDLDHSEQIQTAAMRAVAGEEHSGFHNGEAGLDRLDISIMCHHSTCAKTYAQRDLLP